MPDAWPGTPDPKRASAMTKRLETPPSWVHTETDPLVPLLTTSNEALAAIKLGSNTKLMAKGATKAYRIIIVSPVKTAVYSPYESPTINQSPLNGLYTKVHVSNFSSQFCAASSQVPDKLWGFHSIGERLRFRNNFTRFMG
jgi:hypothetical protein